MQKSRVWIGATVSNVVSESHLALTTRRMLSSVWLVKRPSERTRVIKKHPPNGSLTPSTSRRIPSTEVASQASSWRERSLHRSMYATLSFVTSSASVSRNLRPRREVKTIFFTPR